MRSGSFSNIVDTFGYIFSYTLQICAPALCFAPIVAAVAVPILFKKGKKRAGKIVLFIGCFGLASAIVLTYYLFYPQYVYDPYVYKYNLNEYYIFSFAGLSALLSAYLIFSKSKKKIIVALLSTLIVVSGTITVADFIYELDYEYSTILDAPSYEDLKAYTIHNGTETAVLDEPSTLIFGAEKPAMDGATSFYPLSAAIARATDNYRINYRKFDGAYQAIADKTADIIIVSAPSEEQKKYAEEKGVELVYTPIARDALVFFANSKNNIDNLTSQQIRDIYSGKARYQGQTGVKGLPALYPIQAYHCESDEAQLALTHFMGDTPLATPEELGGYTMLGCLPEYRNTKTGIGYSLSFFARKQCQKEPVKLLSVDGIEPTDENVENGTYPITEEIYAVTRKDADENTQKLVKWILSPQGQKLVRKAGYYTIGDK